jgi:hypothetical protein
MDESPVMGDDDIAIWTTMISKKGGPCLELRMETTAQVAINLFRTTMNSDPMNQTALWDALSEMMDIVQEDIKAEMSEGGLGMVTPIQPKVVNFRKLRSAAILLTHTDRFLVDIGGNRVALYVFEYNAPIVSKQVAQVKINDILMGPVSVGKEEQRKWFVEGMALGPAAIKKLFDIAGEQKGEIRVATRCP